MTKRQQTFGARAPFCRSLMLWAALQDPVGLLTGWDQSKRNHLQWRGEYSPTCPCIWPYSTHPTFAVWQSWEEKRLLKPSQLLLWWHVGKLMWQWQHALPSWFTSSVTSLWHCEDCTAIAMTTWRATQCMGRCKLSCHVLDNYTSV